MTGECVNINIKDFVRGEIKHLEDKIAIKEAKNQEALKSSKDEMNRRLEGMNQIRGQLQDQAKTFVSKDEMKLIERDVKTLNKMVYIGLGIFLFVQLIIGYMLIHLMTK